MFCLIAKSLLECLKDVSLNVVRVELALIFLVLVQLVAHVLLQSLLLNIDLRLGGIVVSLLLIILTFALSELVSESAKLFDFRSQTCLFVLDFVVNLRNESG